MNKNDEILSKILNIETIIEQMHKEMIEIKNYTKEKSYEQLQIMARIENIADFLKTRYNVVIEEKEKFIPEMIENNNRV